MKKIFALLALALVALFSIPAFADSVAVPAGMEFVSPVVGFLQGIPAVGKVLAILFQVIATVSAVMTFLSVAVQGVLKAPEIAALWAGAPAWADKFAGVWAWVGPKLQYLSVFNVQKKG